MNWNPFKKKPKTEKPKSDLQKALDADEAQKEFKPNRQMRRMSKNLNGNNTNHSGRMP